MTHLTSPLPRWFDRASCRDAPVKFFGSRRYVRARRICDSCPVEEACLWWAIANDISSGMWGGLAPEERSALALGLSEVEKLNRLEEESRHLKDSLVAGVG